MNDFLYQVGSVTTTTKWTKPVYEKIVRFLQDVDVSNILEKYESYIHGGILWNAHTWDLDILLKYNWDETTDWDIIEADFNQLNDIALNKHRLLLDVSMANALYKLPTKQYLLDLNKGKEIKDWIIPRVEAAAKEETKIRLSYFKKVMNGEVTEHTETVPHQMITDGYLCKIYLTGIDHKPKIANKIMSMPGEQSPLLQLSVKDFLAMSKDEFAEIKNRSNETFL